MNITLQQFREISNGTHNVGQIRINADGDGLERVNNHVWKTSQNNVMLTAAENRRVRQALLRAFLPLRMTEERYAQLAIELLGEGRDALSLQRDYVKQLLRVVDGNRNVNVEMPRIAKSLRERTVTSRSEYVTSSMEIAHTRHATEEMDDLLQKARAGMVELGTLRCYQDPVQALSKLSECAIRVLRRVGDAAQCDSRLTDEQRRQLGRLQMDAATLINTLRPKLSDVNCASEIRLYMRQRVDDALMAAGVDEEIRGNYLTRIMPGPATLGPREAVLRNRIAALGTLQLDDISNGDLRQYLFELRADLLVCMRHAVHDDLSLPATYRELVKERLGWGNGVNRHFQDRMPAYNAKISEILERYAGDRESLREELAREIRSYLREDIISAFAPLPVFSAVASDYLALAGL